MRKYNYDENEDFQEEIDNFFNNDGSDMSESQEYDLAQSQLELVNREQNERFFFRTIRFLEKSFWWRFRSHKSKLKLIQETLDQFKQINENN